MTIDRVNLTERDWTGHLLQIQRYSIGRRLGAGKAVLDVAGGEGYGAAYLADTADKVVGLGSPEAVAAGRERHGGVGNLAFVQGGVDHLPFEDAAFDLVCCFDVIGSLDAQARTAGVAELRRVLKPGGLLLISVPDRERTARSGRSEQEGLTAEALRELLSPAFPQVALYGQQVNLAALMTPLSAEPAGAVGQIEQASIEDGPRLREASCNRDPTHLMAVCGDAPSVGLASHAFALAGLEPMRAQEDRLGNLRWRLDKLAQQVTDLEFTRDRMAADNVLMAESLSRSLQELAAARPELERLREVEARLSGFYNSRSARLIRRYYGLFDHPVGRRLRPLLGRVARVLLKVLRAVRSRVRA